MFLSTTFVPRFPSGLGRVVVNLLSQNEWNMGMIGFFLEDLTQFLTKDISQLAYACKHKFIIKVLGELRHVKYQELDRRI